MPDVWIVVLNWNGRADTLELLSGLTLEAATVLVVDNGSSDDTLEAVRAAHPNVRTLQTGSNLGYAGGNNAGINHAVANGAELIGVLNNDTIVEPGFLEPLLSVLNTRRFVAVSPDIRYADEPTLSWFRGSKFDDRDGWPVHLQASEQPDSHAGSFVSPVLTGCCIFASVETWRRVGPFDEGLFLMFEDSDWSCRAAALDVELAVVLDSLIRHKVSRSFTGTAKGLGIYYFSRNGLVFAHRHLGGRATRQFLVRQVLRPSARSLLTPGQRSGALLAWLGALAAVFGKRGAAGSLANALARRSAVTAAAGEA
jgi:GT2 family glycosyltransferase